MSGFFCVCSLLPEVVKREFKKYMVHPTARMIRDRIIDRDDFYLYNEPIIIQTSWPTQLLKKDPKHEPFRDPGHWSARLNKYIYMGTYMWWSSTHIKDKLSKEHTNQIEKYIVGDDESYGNKNEKMNRRMRKNICMACKIHTCYCNGNEFLHEYNLNDSLHRHLDDYTKELLLIINNLTFSEIKAMMCDMVKITDNIYEIRWRLGEHHSNEYYINTLRDLKLDVSLLTCQYNKYGPIYYY